MQNEDTNLVVFRPLSPDSPDGTAFQREALGRRSMSEKRKGHADPKSSEFYQRIKENREKGRQYYSGESDLFVCLSVCAFSVSSGCPSFWSGCLFEWGWIVWFARHMRNKSLISVCDGCDFSSWNIRANMSWRGLISQFSHAWSLFLLCENKICSNQHVLIWLFVCLSVCLCFNGRCEKAAYLNWPFLLKCLQLKCLIWLSVRLLVAWTVCWCVHRVF